MNYFLFEESGDSEVTDYFDLCRNRVVADAEDAESCCSDSSDAAQTVQADYPRKNWKLKIITTDHQPTWDGVCNDEADSSTKVVNAIDCHTGAEIKLKSSASESFMISSGVVNMDDITDDRLFWEACLAHGYP